MRARDTTGALIAPHLLVHEGDAAAVWTFEPDVGGVYVIEAQEFTRGASAHGGGYRGSTASHPTETALLAMPLASQSLRVAKRIAQPVGFGASSGSLVLYVSGTDIISTTHAEHGEETPAIQNATGRMVAVQSVTAVQNALAALVGVAASTATGDLGTILGGMISAHNAHLTRGGIHALNDANNALAASVAPVAGSGTDALIAAANMLRRKLVNHMGNTLDGAEVGAAAYHAAIVARADLLNTPIAPPASNAASLCVLLGDLWRAYEAHRDESGTYHTVADPVPLAVLPALLNVHRVVSSELASLTPTVASTEHPGAVAFEALAGFRKS
jgi:hypothetical protein